MRSELWPTDPTPPDDDGPEPCSWSDSSNGSRKQAHGFTATRQWRRTMQRHNPLLSYSGSAMSLRTPSTNTWKLRDRFRLTSTKHPKRLAASVFLNGPTNVATSSDGFLTESGFRNRAFALVSKYLRTIIGFCQRREITQIPSFKLLAHDPYQNVTVQVLSVRST